MKNKKSIQLAAALCSVIVFLGSVFSFSAMAAETESVSSSADISAVSAASGQEIAPPAQIDSVPVPQSVSIAEVNSDISSTDESITSFIPEPAELPSLPAIQEDISSDNNAESELVAYEKSIESLAAQSTIYYPINTLQDLRDAINNEVNIGNDITMVLNADITMSEVITVKGNFFMVAGSGTTLTQSNVAKRNFIFDTSERDITVNFEGVTISGNTTGGGIGVIGGGKLYFQGGTINACRHLHEGGGLSVDSSTFIMNGGLISSNLSLNGGGGVYINNSKFTMNGGSIKNNKATDIHGGGVYIAGSASSFEMTGGTIERNGFASNGGGAGIYVEDGSMDMRGGSVNNNTGSQGSGISVLNGRLTLSANASISYNTNDGVYVRDSVFNMSGGQIDNNTGNGLTITNTWTPQSSAAPDFSITGGTFSGNSIGGISISAAYGTINGPVNIINNGSITGTGGGLSASSSKLIINNVLIKGNSGTSGAGMYIYGLKGITEMNGGEISSNHSNYDGGGLYLTSNCTFRMNGGVIKDNTCADYGGGVHMASTAVFEMYGGSIQGNRAWSAAGVFLNSRSEFKLLGGTIQNNTAEENGGGVGIYDIYSSSLSNFTMNSGLISGNTAGANGGGIYANSPDPSAQGTTVSINGGTIQNNTAGQNGGGMYLGSKTSLDLNNGTIQNNSAKYGGGLYLIDDQTQADLIKGLFTSNRAQLDGGGVFTQNYQNLAAMENVVFKTNQAGNGSYLLAEGDPLLATYNALIKATKFSYSFTRGYNNLDINYTAGRPATSVGYKVQYFQQQLDGSYPAIPQETVTLSGTAGLVPVFAVKEYTGFYYKNTTYESTGNPVSADMQVITGDASLIIKLFYNRNTYTVTYKPGNHGDFQDNIHSGVMYGSTVPAYSGAKDGSVPKGKTGYKFNGWSPSADGPVTQNLVYTAQWAVKPSSSSKPPAKSSSTITSSSVPASSSIAPSGSSSSYIGSSSSISSNPVSSSRLSSSSSPASSSTIPVSSQSTSSAPPVPSSVISEPMEGTTSTVITSKPKQDVTISGASIPFSNFTRNGSWSLLNLMIALASIILVAINILRWVFIKRTQQYDGEGMPLENKRLTTLLSVLRSVSVVCGIMVLIAFIVLENISLPMVFINQNTPVILFFGLLQPVVMIAAVRIKQKRDQWEEQLVREKNNDMFEWMNGKNK